MIRVTGLSCEKQDLFALRKIIDNTISHPELGPFHAELLLSKAVLLHQMGALALALSSTIFALVGYAILESLKTHLYARLARSIDAGMGSTD